MIALDISTPKPRVILDNFNRDSSFCESRAGYVIHSGIHRSTAFISKADHQDGAFAFQYWKAQGQAALNGFIESTIEGLPLLACEAEAFRRSRPDWTVRNVSATGKNSGGELIATRDTGKLVIQVSAFTFRHLHFRTQP